MPEQTQQTHKLRFISFQEHVKHRSMWLGSSVLSDHLYWVLSSDGKFEHKNINISEALLKCFDEILVNALDQYVRAILVPTSEGGPVTFISVDFDRESGEISITNNGQGFDVYNNHPDLDSPDEYTVQAAITREYGGSNFGDIKGDNPAKIDKDSYRVTGGINGLGIKLIVINSVKFSIETVDKIRGKYYYQEINDSMKDIRPPVVKKLSEIKKLQQKTPHTKISFIPDYAQLCKKSKSTPNPNWMKNPDNLAMFEKVMQFRTHQLAAFISCTKYRYDLNDAGKEFRISYNKSTTVKFNDTKITPLSSDAFTKMFPVDKIVKCTIDSEDSSIKFPWDINVCLKPDTKLPYSVSQVNGVFIGESGSHINWLIKQIFDYVSSKISGDSALNKSTKKFTDTHLKNMIMIINCLQIPVPQFSSQAKTGLTLATKELNQLKKTYKIDEKNLQKIWLMLKPRIIEDLTTTRQSIKTDRLQTKFIRKYERARKLGPKSRLFVPEGDSACKPIRDIITDKSNPHLSPKTCGTYNIQGVPPNAIKNSKLNKFGQLEMTKMLENNIAFKGLISAVGLDYAKDYYHSDINIVDRNGITAINIGNSDPKKRARGDAEFAKLNYGDIVIATDQDLDGIGQICSLILGFFVRFWPQLVLRGFVKRLATPLIRVYSSTKKDPTLNFYSDKEYKSWVTANFGDEENLPEKYSVEYYKGLAGHSEEEVLKDIGANILDNIYTFTLDTETFEKINAYYGGQKQSDERKKILTSDIDYEYIEKNQKNKIITCTEHLDNESRAFQLDFMARKLKHAFDGFIPSQRKAFAGARKLWANGGGPKKVYQVTGYVTTKMHYQHGDTSMNDTIIKLAQNFTGGCNLPIFMPISNGFGSRKTGRDEAGSPRYINTKLNSKFTDLMFPRQDDWLLEYVFEDGEQAEPKFYVPVLPISIMETSTTVSVGWNISCWGRDPYEVIKIVKRMIMFDDYPQMKPMSLLGMPWVKEGMRVKICPISNSKTALNPTEVCLGEWTYNDKTETVTITQLPLKIWSEDFKNGLLGIKKISAAAAANSSKSKDQQNKKNDDECGKDLVEEVYDDTGNDLNDIVIKLKPGALNEIVERGYGTDEIHPLEDYLGIKQQMHCRLNMITETGKVKEFQQYSDVVEYWYPMRKKMYISRLQRLTIILEAKIDFYENKLRFCEEDSSKKINIDKDFSKEKREKILNDAKYKKFNKTRLFKPKYISSDMLRKNIYEIKAGYDYIDQITVGEKSMEGMRKQKKDLESAKAELEDLRKVTWQSLWLKEIDELEKIIQEGEKTKWLFETKQHVFKKGK